MCGSTDFFKIQVYGPQSCTLWVDLWVDLVQACSAVWVGNLW